MACAINQAGSVYVKDSRYTASDLTDGHASWLEGVYLVYELATPTTESADPFQSPQIVDDWGTEEYIVTEQGGVAMPVGHETQYPANLRDKLQHLPDLASSDGYYVINQNGSQMTLVAPDTTVEEDSSKPVTSGAVYTAIYGAMEASY